MRTLQIIKRLSVILLFDANQKTEENTIKQIRDFLFGHKSKANNRERWWSRMWLIELCAFHDSVARQFWPQRNTCACLEFRRKVFGPPLIGRPKVIYKCWSIQIKNRSPLDGSAKAFNLTQAAIPLYASLVVGIFWALFVLCISPKNQTDRSSTRQANVLSKRVVWNDVERALPPTDYKTLIPVP